VDGTSGRLWRQPDPGLTVPGNRLLTAHWRGTEALMVLRARERIPGVRFQVLRRNERRLGRVLLKRDGLWQAHAAASRTRAMTFIIKTAVEHGWQQPDARLPGARRAKERSPRRKPWVAARCKRSPGVGGEVTHTRCFRPDSGAPPQSASRPSAHALGYILTRCRALSVAGRFDFSTAPQFTLRGDPASFQALAGTKVRFRTGLQLPFLGSWDCPSLTGLRAAAYRTPVACSRWA
jgi:hypothetical protein